MKLNLLLLLEQEGTLGFLFEGLSLMALHEQDQI